MPVSQIGMKKKKDYGIFSYSFRFREFAIMRTFANQILSWILSTIVLGIRVRDAFRSVNKCDPAP